MGTSTSWVTHLTIVVLNDDVSIDSASSYSYYLVGESADYGVTSTAD